MIKIKDKNNCCGCTACVSICSHDAISMQPDALGFLYPFVDEKKCVDCGLCEKVCAFKSDYDISNNLSTPIVYGARHKDIDEVMKSRSGAAFVAISDYVLEHGGVVYGVGYKEHFKVSHKRAITKEQRDEFRGSKYVQSDLSEVFQEIRKDLCSGLYVLFSGTPCQTAGLNAYIGKKLREKLLLVDIVCHGVPGPYIWRDYLSFIEQKRNGLVKEVDFRNKSIGGWADQIDTYVFEKEQEVDNTLTFATIFDSEITLRKSCFHCKYTNIKRPSDITLADFWGWEKVNPEANIDNKGLSLILCNTPKGLDIFKNVKHNMYFFEVFTKDYMQSRLKSPTIPHPLRDEFEKYYAEYGFEKAMKRFALMGWRKNYNEFIEKQLRRIKKYTRKIFHI